MGESNLNEKQIEHPSFAVINISRVQIGGGHKNLFDSPFKHYHAITLEISPAVLIRKLHGDMIMPTGGLPHISVAMSEVQFANLVLNANLHGGTPCTVEHIGGKRVPEPPKANLKKLWADEVKADFKDVADAVHKAEKGVDALLAKDRVTKADLKALQETIRVMAADVRSNLPWMQERFEETMEKTVAAAKGEIEAHLAHTIKQAGLSSLKGADVPRLEIEGEAGPRKA